MERQSTPDVVIDNVETDDSHLSKKEEERIRMMSNDQRTRAIRNMQTISVAPGEKGEFRNWKKDVFLEEQSFPNLFPYGTGGYLSSCISSGKNMGFSVYCRNR